MRQTKLSRAAAVLLCAAGLAATAPEAGAAPRASEASVVAPPVPCLSGLRRAQVRCLPAATRRLCIVQYAWVPFTTSGIPCLKK